MTCISLYRLIFMRYFYRFSRIVGTREFRKARQDRNARIYPVDTFVFNDYLRAEKSEFLQVFTVRARYSSVRWLRTRMLFANKHMRAWRCTGCRWATGFSVAAMNIIVWIILSNRGKKFTSKRYFVTSFNSEAIKVEAIIFARNHNLLDAICEF